MGSGPMLIRKVTKINVGFRSCTYCILFALNQLVSKTEKRLSGRKNRFKAFIVPRVPEEQRVVSASFLKPRLLNTAKCSLTMSPRPSTE